MYDTTVHRPGVLRNNLIEIIGETVERQGNRVRRIAAKEIIKCDNIIYYSKDIQDVMMAAVKIADLRYCLASPSTYFAGELLGEPPERYSADGILFSALVHLVRIEEDLFAWEWFPEQVRALGLAINPGEELAWPITRNWVSIKDREGNYRPFYRLSS